MSGYNSLAYRHQKWLKEVRPNRTFLACILRLDSSKHTCTSLFSIFPGFLFWQNTQNFDHIGRHPSRSDANLHQTLLSDLPKWKTFNILRKRGKNEEAPRLTTKTTSHETHESSGAAACRRSYSRSRPQPPLMTLSCFSPAKQVHWFVLPKLRSKAVRHLYLLEAVTV